MVAKETIRMNDDIERVRTAARVALAKDVGVRTGARIREVIWMMRALLAPGLDDASVEMLARGFEAHLVVTVPDPDVIAREHQPWLDAKRKDIAFDYWNDYQSLLEGVLPPRVVQSLHGVTDQIVDHLEDPTKPGPWDRRGMVVGHVQSGKTQNYIGAICKAADAGYRIIVVIAGLHNSLRSQTQARIDEGFIGRVSAHASSGASRVGVGLLPDRKQFPATFTTVMQDFNQGMERAALVQMDSLRVPLVLVVKKQATVLKSVRDWLKKNASTPGARLSDVPMLLIDDEADNASINTLHHVGGATRINALIREILQHFKRSCYVGYTATPFANIFIDPKTTTDMLGDDLFPRDFIVNLEPPSNYLGAQRVFVDDAESFVRPITDNDPCIPIAQKAGQQIDCIPPSLVDAMRAFILARAIRLIRGGATVHCSMLVNASVRNDVQAQIRFKVRSELDRMRAAIRVHASLPPELAVADSEIAAFHRVWAAEYGPEARCPADAPWADVLAGLHDSVSPIATLLVNGRSSDALDYAQHAGDGRSVIAIGGFSLSRGLTLEGLMVSYFLRKSMMYDTLLQMGRWFGYRDGYADLCRVWMPDESSGWYSHIAEASEELREQFREMAANQATPQDFGLRVRSHPANLLITARNKIGAGEQREMEVRLAGQLIETTPLLRDADSRATNRRAVIQLAQAIAARDDIRERAIREPSLGYLASRIGVEHILEFLRNFKNHPSCLRTDREMVAGYIGDRRHDELREWDVLFTSLQRLPVGGSNIVDTSLGFEIITQARAEGSQEQRPLKNGILVTGNQRVAARGVERAGLTTDQIEEAESNWKADQLKKGLPANNPPDKVFRTVKGRRPLLMVHLLTILPVGGSPATPVFSEPVVAWGIGFPTTQREDSPAKYWLNAVAIAEELGTDADDDELNDEDLDGLRGAVDA